MESCVKRKYKKPILKKCLSLNLPVNESMSISELCRIYHNQTPTTTVPRRRSTNSQPVTSSTTSLTRRKSAKKTTNVMKMHYEKREFDWMADYIVKCFKN